jgi:beta-lactamase class D
MKITLLMLLCSAAIADECFIVDGKSSGALCKKRLPPCSTFKLPLAAMALDAGILDEKTVLRWDKTPQRIKSWEQDADAKAWLKESIVWFSQRLTPQLGLPKIQKYLKDYNYGNQDFSGGITTAWLESSLQISPEEQLKFLEKLPSLPSGKRAIALLPADGDVRGKTGSCMTPHIGWFVGYYKDRPFVYVFDGPSKKYAGLQAKEEVLARLKER